jgi:hypothetical protein
VTTCHPPRKPQDAGLTVLIVKPVAVLAESIVARSGSPFICRNVTPWRTRAIVVMDSPIYWFVLFVDREKGEYSWHGVASLLVVTTVTVDNQGGQPYHRRFSGWPSWPPESECGAT